MSACYTAPYTIPAATLGPENPLPDIKNVSYIHAEIEATKAVPPELTTYIDKGMVDTMLPYTQQDSYDRNRVLRTFKAIILENEHLKATFIPELGGRLWSLWDKDSARELLYCNPVFQPGNLALRNAWFSGGVEFNVSIKGHHPMTCSDMFARHITMADGTPGVRMYEYERIRGTAYGFDAWLPDGSKLLFIRPRIENNTDHDVWTYWWSNIAVSYTDGMRVIVPADKTFVNYADDNHYYLDFADVPVANGVDISYPKNVKIAQDFFFYIPDCAPKWIAAVDEHGVGMMQCSTRNLLGRKLFVWGDSHGGDNWKNFLSDGTNNGYVEIQAGLARTQLEHIPLEEGCVYTWAEAYGALEKPAEKLHGDWQTAQDTVVEAMEEAFDHNIDNVLNSMKIISATAGEMIHMGSGWGCLEQLRRKADGEHKPLSYWYDFPESTITGAQMPWYNLLRCGRLDSADPLAVPDGYLVDNKWLLRMEKAMERPENQSWFGWMHLGLMRYANSDVRGAMWAFDSSLALEPSPWVLRNLAMIHGNEYDNFKKAREYMERSVQMEPNNRWLWIDMAVLCLKAGLYQYWVDLYFTIPENIRAEGRLKVYTAIALTHLGQLDEACAYLNHDLLVPDIKEDENLITEAWFALYGAIIAQKTGIHNPDQLRKMVESEYPLGELDFRMH
jgi:tetratricopeptide (TPR) repeat protein